MSKWLTAQCAHVGMAFALTATLNLFYPLWEAALMVVAIALVKELFDGITEAQPYLGAFVDFLFFLVGIIWWGGLFVFSRMA
jgi:hypothetical protein